MKIVLIAGAKRSGKDFSASLLKNKLPRSEIFAFADPIKIMASETLGITVAEFDNFKNNSAMLYEGNDEFG